METTRPSINRITVESRRELEAPEMSSSPIPIQQDDITERLLRYERPQYGSLPINRTETRPIQKRYRLPFLILLAFEWAVVVFLSVVVYAEVRAAI